MGMMRPDMISSRVFGELDLVELGFVGDLPGALGGDVHQEIAVIHLGQQFGHRGMQHNVILLFLRKMDL